MVDIVRRYRRYLILIIRTRPDKKLTGFLRESYSGSSLFGGVGTVLPGTVLGTLLIQMVQSGLVFARVDIFAQPLFQAGVILLAVLIDSLRSGLIARLSRRNIRKLEGNT